MLLPDGTSVNHTLVQTAGAGGYTVHFDPDAIRRKGDLVKMWVLYDYKTIQTTVEGSYLSSRVLKQFNCAEEREQSLAATWFSGNLGHDNVVFNNTGERKRQPVAPESVGQALWKLACGKP